MLHNGGVCLRLSRASARVLIWSLLQNSLFKVSWKALLFLSKGVFAKILSTSYMFGGSDRVSSPSSSSTASSSTTSLSAIAAGLPATPAVR